MYGKVEDLTRYLRMEDLGAALPLVYCLPPSHVQPRGEIGLADHLAVEKAGKFLRDIASGIQRVGVLLYYTTSVLHKHFGR